MTERRINDLVTQHKRLVYRMARRYTIGRADAYLDLVQEGFVGLCRAARTYDPARGNAFSTYATYWARKQMLSYLQKLSCVHVPDREQLEQWRVRKMAARVYARTGIDIVDDVPTCRADDVTLIADDTAAMVEQHALGRAVNRVAGVLTKRERSVIQSCLTGSTLADYGKRNKVSKQYATQCYQAAVGKLRQALEA